MAVNVSIPKGTRDFTPIEIKRRKHIFEIIENEFQVFGYRPIETPAMENLSTLTGKYGEEGDRLIFKILNSGDFLDGVQDTELKKISTAKLANKICEKALRYDLTVPFARYVTMNRNNITFPFRRYQIQPVWRADRPQKGRYREFYQCDVDVIGSNSLLCEVDMIQVIDKVFEQLGLKVVIKLNNRKILSGIAEVIGAPDKIIDITVAIDKIEKIGLEKVNQELQSKGLSAESIAKLQPILTLKGTNEAKLKKIKTIIGKTETGLKGNEELTQIFTYIKSIKPKAKVELDLTLARGLDYYTGAIIEVKAKDVEMGSICGGGRYDNLTGVFGLPDVSGVGVSFGADRIYDLMNELHLFPEESGISTRVLFINFGSEEEIFALQGLTQMRDAGVASELYPEPAKLKKQLAYANAHNIPWVAMAGSEEISQDLFKLKNMSTGKEQLMCIENLILEVFPDVEMQLIKV